MNTSIFLNHLAAMSAKGAPGLIYMGKGPVTLKEGYYPDQADLTIPTEKPSKGFPKDRGAYPSIQPNSPADGLQSEGNENLFSEDVLDYDTDQLTQLFEDSDELSEVLDQLTAEDLNELLESDDLDDVIFGIAGAIRLNNDLGLMEELESLTEDELQALLAESGEPEGEPEPEEEDEDEGLEIEECTDEELEEALSHLTDEELEAVLAEVNSQ